MQQSFKKNTANIILICNFLDSLYQNSATSPKSPHVVDSVEDLIFQAKEFVKITKKSKGLVTTSDWQRIHDQTDCSANRSKSHGKLSKLYSSNHQKL